ncbi:hypothetical protein M0R45_031957 [Rubus argutus]|uniref:Gnk2-homologous domain-containing protein n=1 Tax=Rubus argutus TaxID=59490 RepID=A0AAW1WHR8_RUBAR
MLDITEIVYTIIYMAYSCYKSLFLCRDDITTAACRAFIPTAIAETVKLCPIEKQVVIWYDDCMLCYSNQSFFSTADESAGLFMWNTRNVTTEPNWFNLFLEASMTEVATETAQETTTNLPRKKRILRD